MSDVSRRPPGSTPSVDRGWIRRNLDLVLVGCASALVLMASESAWLPVLVATKEISALLISLEAAAAAAAAILAAVVHRLAPDRRAAWISAAFALYGLGGLPLFAIGVAAESGWPDLRLVHVFTSVLLVGLLFIAACAPRRHRSVRPLRITALAFAAVGLAAIGLSASPGAAELLTVDVSVRLVVAAGGLAAGAMLWCRALVERSPQSARVGAGVTVVTATDVVWNCLVWAGMGPPAATLAAWRCVGLMLVLLGLGALAGQTLRSVREAKERCRTELHSALAARRELADRERELRMSLGGLSELLTGQVDDASARRALRSELVRLDSLLAPDRDLSAGLSGARVTSMPDSRSARAS